LSTINKRFFISKDGLMCPNKTTKIYYEPKGEMFRLKMGIKNRGESMIDSAEHFWGVKAEKSPSHDICITLHISNKAFLRQLIT
jgi:hypothetical protein